MLQNGDALLHEIQLGTYVISNWNDFEDRFCLTFGNPHHADEVQCMLHHIIWGNHTAEEFFITFEDIKANAGFCDSAIVFQLLCAICKDIHERSNDAAQSPSTMTNGRKPSYRLTKTYVEMLPPTLFMTPTYIHKIISYLPSHHVLSQIPIDSQLPHAKSLCQC